MSVARCSPPRLHRVFLSEYITSSAQTASGKGGRSSSKPKTHNSVPLPRLGKTNRRRNLPTADDSNQKRQHPGTTKSSSPPDDSQVAAAYCAGGPLPLHLARKELASHMREANMSPGYHRSTADVLHFKDSRERAFRHVFVFSSGPTVYWGLPLASRRQVEDQLQNLRSTTLATSSTSIPLTIDQFDHEFHFETQTESKADKSDFRDDKITLRGGSGIDHSDELLAISYGLAQSVQLMVYEEVIDRLVDQTAALPTELASRGLISLPPANIKRKIGELLAARYAVNLLTDILDTPEFFWDHPELSSLYTECTDELDLGVRAGILDKRMTIIKDMLDVLNDELASESSLRVERAILLLIAIEVALEIGSRII